MAAHHNALVNNMATTHSACGITVMFAYAIPDGIVDILQSVVAAGVTTVLDIILSPVWCCDECLPLSCAVKRWSDVLSWMGGLASDGGISVPPSQAYPWPPRHIRGRTVIAESRPSISSRLSAKKPVFEYEYYQEGDVIIGGLVSAHSRTTEHKTLDGKSILCSLCTFINIEEYRSILALIFAVDEINKDPNLLPNVTLGYHIFNTCGDPKLALGYVLQILSGENMEAPNYSCKGNREVAGFIGDSRFHTTHAMAQVLSLYQYTQLHSYVKKVNYLDSTGAEIFFNDQAEVPTKLILANLVIYKTKTDFKFVTVPLLVFNTTLDDNNVFNIEVNNISWKNATIPESRCNDRCPYGYRKATNGRIHVCCYDCIPCSEGEMSNVTDSETCHKCPNEEWPDETKGTCVLKTYIFLSYENDVIVTIFSLSVLLFSAITLFILFSFIYYWDSPVVKANNRTVSFILLISILLSFLCVFLFLGRPVDITCMLRQVSFGIFFSIAVSCVLAKTMTVCIAFKATKPGSSWRKWVGVRVSYFVFLSCSSVQVLICVIWLSVSPPHHEYGMYSYPGKIIIQCNEGSVIAFYSVLGYMGLLAAVSFLLAFMVRTLPDSFNEAKYITFSMLVFCSVWIAMIPAYLSTRGKYMVTVEIFAILSSSAGVLGGIFFPKLYILFFKPEMNSRKIMLV
ncbi:PREDICTED: vomeronasal type-2 receptor 26-like [Nanorana parkeri]|uniref:vomeronasal type-2 receptor 26-like n=1 Tax=Nanorana parkeri TaxID=125878 RepID=UPI00085450B5|nr:PREDICTED: vomeronasal type-2 receptor 26-like [Nanorana parkeri]